MSQTNAFQVGGHAFHFRITFRDVRRINLKTGFDVLELMNPGSESFLKITQDHFAMFDIMVAALEPQLSEKGLDEDSFSELLETEEDIVNASTAMVQGFISFSQREKADALGAAFSQVATKTRDVIRQRDLAMAEAMKGPAWNKIVDQSVEAALNGSPDPLPPEPNPNADPSEIQSHEPEPSPTPGS